MNRRTLLKRAALAGIGLPLVGQQADTEAFRRIRETVVHRKIQPWFPKAGLGIMMPWGPYTVGEIEGGWGIFQDMAPPNKYWPVEKYMALADQFNPQNYDPNRWMAAAVRAGFKYTVFTLRHHDGFAMWPSDYGEFGTKQHLKGRDLVRPFVDACRKNGIKVGFGYSPTDWLFNPNGWPWRGFPLRDYGFKYRRPERTKGLPRYADMPIEQIQKYFEQLYAVIKGQMGEVMTRYGKIDLLWWDGYDWPVGTDHHGREMEDYVRKLQPEIVMNDRNMIWDKGRTLGDFSTAFENRNPGEPPEGVWEQCEAGCGCWSYVGEYRPCRSAAYIIERLVRNRAWGGNYVIGIGPRADGTMRPAFYDLCDQMEAWMKHSAESVFDVGAGPYPKRADVPVTIKGGTWYLHFLKSEQRTATLTGVPNAASAKILRTGQAAKLKKDGDRVVVTLPDTPQTEMDEVVAVS
ncbi:MAG: alpha-L-fucosidase [Bryobacteraceae bacterium]